MEIDKYISRVFTGFSALIMLGAIGLFGWVLSSVALQHPIGAAACGGLLVVAYLIGKVVEG